MHFCIEPPLLFTGLAHPTLAQAIAREYEIPLGVCNVGRHPDNEPSVKIGDNVRGRDVFIIQPTHSRPESMSDNLFELLVMVDAARRASAGRITAVMPYFGFARQDRKDEGRVPITAKLVIELLEAAGVDRLLTIDIHSEQISGFSNAPFDLLYGGTVLRSYAKTLSLEPLCIVGADLGAIKRASSWASRLDASFACNVKDRLSDTRVAIKNVIGDVRGQHVIIVDDESSTGATLLAGAEKDLAEGALSVRAAITHVKLQPHALRQLADSQLVELLVTDTLPLPELPPTFTICSVAPMLAGAIRAIHEQTSISVFID